MPTIQIDRSRSRTPSSTGVAPSGLISLDTTSVLSEVGAAFSDFRAKAQEAEDATYVANSGIEAQKNATSIRAELQKKYTQDPRGYAEELYTRLSEDVYKPIIDNAPSKRARMAAEKNLAGYARADIAKDTEWERQSTVASYLNNHNQNINLLSQEIAANPNNYQSIMAQYELLSDVSSTYLGPKEYNEAKERDKKILGEALFSGTLESSPSRAVSILNSPEFKGIFNADDIRGMEVKAAKRQAVFKNEGEQQVLAGSLKIFELASSGQLSLATIDNEKGLTTQDKQTAKALLTGDETAIKALADLASVTKGDMDSIDSYSLASDLREITESFNRSGEERSFFNPARYVSGNTKFKTNEDISTALERLNIMKNKATIARAFNAKNRGKGVTKTEYEDILGNINAASEKLLTYADGNSPIYSNDTVYDYLYDEVNNLTDDRQIKAELLGYASSVAKSRGVDVFSEVDGESAKTLLKPVMTELKQRRRKSLGIELSAPDTPTALINGRKETLGQGDPSVAPDRNISTPFKIMQDKNGNKARVYPDGRIEEIK